MFVCVCVCYNLSHFTPPDLSPTSKIVLFHVRERDVFLPCLRLRVGILVQHDTYAIHTWLVPPPPRGFP